MEDERNNVVASGVTRGQNQLHVLPEDWAAAAAVIEPLLARIDATDASTQLLVVTGDGEAADGIVRRLAGLVPPNVRIVAATESRRAMRALKAGGAHVLAGSATVLLELSKAVVLKPGALRAVVLAWVEGSDAPSAAALETLMGELPKDMARFVLAADAAAADSLVERYAWRARRMQPGESEPPVSLSYLTTGDATRPATLRRLLDALDPATAVVVVRGRASREEAEGQLRTLGFAGDSAAVRVSEQAIPDTDLMVIYDLPPSDTELRRLVRAGGKSRIIALVTARQVRSLRQFAGSSATPFIVPEPANRARASEAAMRAQLRETLESGQYGRELLALEPLLSEFDGAEVAAAALRLLEIERTKRQAAASEASTGGAMTRLFFNVGEMDAVRANDLVGAIMNEAGVSRAELGRVEVRERHSTVEVASVVAENVVAKLTGVSIKGRRAMVKVDQGRERRGDAPDRRERGDRADRGDRRERPSRPRTPRR